MDWTIADFVSDFRAHTPTAAAEKVVAAWDELEHKLRESRERMQNAASNLIDVKKEALSRLKESYALRQPLVYVQQLSQRVDELLRQMHNYLKGVVQEKKQLFRACVGKLEALSPLGILERGYSITFDGHGNLVKEIKQVRTGELIQTRLRSGIIKSKITEMETT